MPPLSPHLSIYKPQITSVLSILHRITGVVALLVFLEGLLWLLALATGERYFIWLKALFTSPLGLGVQLGMTWCVFYHFYNGVRHLFWDVGLGFSLRVVTRSGIAVLLLTFLSWGCWWWAWWRVG